LEPQYCSFPEPEPHQFYAAPATLIIIDAATRLSQYRFLLTIYISTVFIFQGQVISTFKYFNFSYRRGKLTSQYYVVRMTGRCDCLALPARLCLSYCLYQVYHIIAKKNNISLLHNHTQTTVPVNSVLKLLKYKIIEITMHCVEQCCGAASFLCGSGSR
jgi:hypothetical protein